MKVHFLIVGIIIIAVLCSGCSEQSQTDTTNPVSTPTITQQNYVAGDIVAKTSTSTDTLWLILNYDSKTDKYERALVYKMSGNTWYRKDNKTELIERSVAEKLYPAKVSHVTSISSISIITPTMTSTSTKTSPPGPAPSISSITPNSGTTGYSVSITNLAGSSFQTGATVKLVGTDGTSVSASNVVVSQNTITCSFNLYDIKTGKYDIVITNPDGQSDILPQGFTVNDAGPLISTITPSQGMIGANIDLTIVGSGFKNPAKVTFTKGTEGLDCANTVTNTATQITCVLTIPQGTTIGGWDITVKNIEDQQNGTVSNKFTIINNTITSPTTTGTT
ncbi:MAG: hypothetical protein ABR887_03590 [Methanoregulaceae archaeon]|jgi:hypothetical protein